MRKATLSILIYISLAIAILSYVAAYSGGLNKENEHLAKYIFMITFGLVPSLLILKLISTSFFLSGLSGMPLPQLEGVFAIFYIFLTKEARIEWKKKIEQEKSRKKIKQNTEG